ncbi:MAG: DUF2277 domain-containing protein [Candidatus Promineifilaceae bacterium]
MCRNIKKLRYPDRPPTDAELHEAALQFVRKISGYRAPSRANQAAFDQAVADVAAAAHNLFHHLAPATGAVDEPASPTH